MSPLVPREALPVSRAGPLASSCRLLSRSRDSPLFDFIESCLRNKHEMVVYEAASAIVNLPGCSAKELAPAVSGDQALPTQAPHGCACQELGPGPGGTGKKGNALRWAPGYA